MTFEEILTSVLESYEKNPNQDIDVLIEKLSEENELPEDMKTSLKETNEYLDGFATNAESLAKAKAEGKSRKRWMLEQIDRITDGRPEEEKAKIVSAISDANEQVMERMSNQE